MVVCKSINIPIVLNQEQIKGNVSFLICQKSETWDKNGNTIMLFGIVNLVPPLAFDRSKSIYDVDSSQSSRQVCKMWKMIFKPYYM